LAYDNEVIRYVSDEIIPFGGRSYFESANLLKGDHRTRFFLSFLRKSVPYLKTEILFAFALPKSYLLSIVGYYVTQGNQFFAGVNSNNDQFFARIDTGNNSDRILAL
jgi:hypothetical protein